MHADFKARRVDSGVSGRLLAPVSLELVDFEVMVINVGSGFQRIGIENFTRILALATLLFRV